MDLLSKQCIKSKNTHCSMTTHKTHIYLSVNNILKSKKQGKKNLGHDCHCSHYYFTQTMNGLQLRHQSSETRILKLSNS